MKKTFSLCAHCFEMAELYPFEPGDRLTTTSSEFDYCSSCSSFTSTPHAMAVEVDPTPVEEVKPREFGKHWNGGEYAFYSWAVAAQLAPTLAS